MWNGLGDKTSGHGEKVVSRRENEFKLHGVKTHTGADGWVNDKTDEVVDMLWYS